MRRVYVFLCIMALAFLWTIEASAKVVEITYWCSILPPNNAHMRAMVEDFNREHPSIRVRMEEPAGHVNKAIIAAAGGAPPDVIWASFVNFGDLAATGALVNLEDRFLRPQGLYDDFQEDFLPFLWETSKYRGKIYAIPFDTGCFLMFYNRDMMEAAGIRVPSDGWTWEEYAQNCMKLTNIPKGIYGYASQFNPYHFYSFLLCAGAPDFFSPEGDKAIFNSEEGIRALQFWVDLVHKWKGAVYPAPSFMMFEERRAATEFQGSYRLPRYKETAQFDFWVGPLPRDKRRAVYSGGESLYIFKTTREREDAAWEFVKWMTSTKANARWSMLSGYQPVRKSVVSEESYVQFLNKNPLMKPFTYEALKYGTRFFAVPGFGVKIDPIINKAIADALSMRSTPKQALDAAALAVNNALSGTAPGK